MEVIYRLHIRLQTFSKLSFIGPHRGTSFFAVDNSLLASSYAFLFKRTHSLCEYIKVDVISTSVSLMRMVVASPRPTYWGRAGNPLLYRLFRKALGDFFS